MYDELVATLRRQCVEMSCGNCGTCVMRQAADAIEERCQQVDKFAEEAARLYAKLPRWIPVAERLPEEYVNVLCHLRSLDRQSEYYSIDHLMEDGQWWKAANSWKYEVTHWMPLPEPPKEEEA